MEGSSTVKMLLYELRVRTDDVRIVAPSAGDMGVKWAIKWCNER